MLRKRFSAIIWIVFVLAIAGFFAYASQTIAVRQAHKAEIIKPKVEFAQAVIMWAFIDKLYGDQLSSQIPLSVIMYYPERVARLLLDIKTLRAQIAASHYRPPKFDRREIY